MLRTRLHCSTSWLPTSKHQLRASSSGIAELTSSRRFVSPRSMSYGTDGSCCPPAAPRPAPKYPVLEPAGHKLKGTYQQVGDFKTYVVGPDDAKHALVVIYDIFGFWETTQQGSDILAAHLASTNATKIYMPDVFRGHPFPRDKDGDKDELSKFFSGTAKISDRLPEVIEFGRQLKEKYDRVSLLGYCWGGKVTLLALSKEVSPPTPFCCGSIIHPAMIAAEDGENLAVPLGFYPSKDEPEDAIEAINKAIQAKEFAGKCDFHHYTTVHHGWAAARANLKDPENLKQYEDVYERASKYFAKSCC